jgi:hypothetical protein
LKKAFDKTWHFGLLYKLSELKFSISQIKFVSSFLSQRKFTVNGRRLPHKLAATKKQGSPHHWKFCKVHIGSRFSHGFQRSVYIRLYNTTVQPQAEVILNHETEHVRGIGQGEARHRKYKRFKLGGGQTYDSSSD